ncbi:hypothetical protein LTR62_006548 [Meristemomyces frigidus]|uniref:CAP-Gly domain-containing protein n=1 Tax=Meristemomyces frigidus TaxID=1508187 RepID=A0AAN7TCE5_9PEZI|nr:hypothetical protein LTR62_006548 [Meristemomyces frigidus]
MQTPRQRLQRPSYGNTGSAERSLSASTNVNRKVSSNGLNESQMRTPTGRGDGSALEVGDVVSVPGDMSGTVRFVGQVRGKTGRFVGVELDEEFAARGKNNGDVDGVTYFNTNIPGAGIFLPIHRAEKRASPSASLDSFPATPNTPSYSTLNGKNAYTPPTPAVQHKFSQSMGPGAQRPASPQFKPKRPSLPRPESPLRRPAPNLAPTPARGFSSSVRGGRAPLGSSTTPSKTNLRASTSTRPSTTHTPRPYSRTGSRLGHRQDTLVEEERTNASTAAKGNGRTISTSSVPSFSQPLRSPSRLGSAGGQDAEIQRLRLELADREKQLSEQAASLADMESNVKELSALLPTDGPTPGGSMRNGDDGEHSAAQLRQLLREKNEKISLLTQEFDTHRADFRSTLDSLEMASTETERVYEEQKTDLLAQVESLQRQTEQLQEEVALGGNGVGGKEDLDSIVNELKRLEELVAELEEGLEESRRGEAEARGEVEFLRGEVERGRSELRREREKAAALHAQSNGTVTPKDMEQKDDEIRGLKAIIHGLSTTPVPNTNGHGSGSDLDELRRVRSEKEDLERELEQFRRNAATTNGSQHRRNESERTATASGTDRPMPLRQRSGTLKPTFAEHSRRANMPEEHETANGDISEDVYCEMCESKDHDTLDCTHLNGNGGESPVKGFASTPPQSEHTPGKENRGENTSDLSRKGITGAAEDDKWCALCEEDGHLAFDCPKEQY